MVAAVLSARGKTIDREPPASDALLKREGVRRPRRAEARRKHNLYGDLKRGSIMIAWHYTTGIGFTGIVADGYIRPATSLVPPGERPVVWFSTNQFWEYTANKGWWDEIDGKSGTLTMQQTAERCGGLFRFGVLHEDAPYDWRQIRQLSGMSTRMANGLHKVATAAGASPREWRGSFEPVAREKWVAVETMKDGAWVPVTTVTCGNTGSDEDPGSEGHEQARGCGCSASLRPFDGEVSGSGAEGAT
jgi:hypothetical protein